MRLLLVHNRYQQPGGEDVVFEAEAALLRGHGHEVEEWVEHNRDIAGMSPARLAVRTIWSAPAVRRLRGILARLQPEIVHFHNTFPLISPAVYATCRSHGVPVVQTLHNYRLLCPNAMLFRDGRPCEDCVQRAVAWPGVLHACYRGSRSQTAVIATMLGAHRLIGTWRGDVDRYVALTEFARRKFIAGGLPPDRIVVKPNFVSVSPDMIRPDAGYFLFAGRLTEEKGVRTLLEAWRRSPPPADLRIAGGGPLEPVVRHAAETIPGVRYLGRLTRENLLSEVGAASALILPSEWYEGLPTIVLEAFGCGRPVLAARVGALEEIVSEGATGVFFPPGDSDGLAALVRWAAGHADDLARMGANAREEYQRRYTAEVNYPQLIDIYRQAAGRGPSDGTTAPVPRE
jgi:glycosyltransferase involved in cell wall biosynthesis